MDHRAYHLQAESRAAVTRAIRTGALVRQPCEACGERAHAHHDSYFPDRWLDVRWLCPTHHRRWHMDNEPEWPDVFDFHPTDVDPHPARVAPRSGPKGGRPSCPWFRKGSGRWYVKIQGKAHNLGPDREEAVRRFHELLGG